MTPVINHCHGFPENAGVGVKVCEMPMDAPFYGGSNDTIGGRRYRRFGLN
jgi:hypothetical protein